MCIDLASLFPRGIYVEEVYEHLREHLCQEIPLEPKPRPPVRPGCDCITPLTSLQPHPEQEGYGPSVLTNLVRGFSAVFPWHS